eukprot:Hpha_TRINITY_DN15719_c2_g1::TRINITY_DN15719_c2_g1_i10::g.36814::m.36814
MGDVRPGDWTCPECNANVFASKRNCFKCGAEKPGGDAGGGGGWGGGGGGFGGGWGGGGGGGGNTRPGDWTCSACGANCFASRQTCFKCNAPKEGGGGGGGGGSWGGGGGGSWGGGGGGGGQWGGGGGGGQWGGGGGGQSNVRPGDWACPSCGANCFASRSECFKCGTAKP